MVMSIIDIFYVYQKVKTHAWMQYGQLSDRFDWGMVVFKPSKTNKPRTAKVGAISKAQNCKRGDSLGFVKLQLVAKYEKNELNSVTVSKNVKGGTLWAL